MGKGLAWWVAYGVAVASAMASTFPLGLEWGTLETGNDSAQAAFRLLQSSAPAPVAQRLSGRGTAPWIVQGADAARGAWQQTLEAAGAVIRGYLPENALLIEAAPEAVPKIAALNGVAWMGEYLPAYKKSPALAGGPDGKRECVVELFAAADKPRIGRDFGEMGVRVARGEMEAAHPFFHVGLSPAQMDEVAQWSEVEWIEPAATMKSWGASMAATIASTDLAAELAAAQTAGERVGLLRQGVADAGAYGAAARAADAFVLAHPDFLVVAAAGNAAVDLAPADGVADAGSVGSPATAKNILSVGATEGRIDVARVWRDSWPEDFAVQPIALDPMAQAAGPQGLAAFSGRGPCADGRIKPDLVAPGTYVAVPRPPDSAYEGWGVAPDTNQVYVGGTGVAAEQVAEAARQVRKWLGGSRGIPSPSAALVKAVLIAGARDLSPGQYGTGPKQEIPDVRPNHAQGFGLLDLANALEANEGGEIELHDAPGLATGAADVYELRAQAAGDRFVLALAYSDHPASPAAGRTLVNDLDLAVATPSGAVLHPNGRTAPDHLNNVEMIEFEADEAGIFMARVEARAVPMGGSQPYALVVRGSQAPAVAAAPAETK